MPHEVKLKVIIVKQAVILAKRGDKIVKFLIVEMFSKNNRDNLAKWIKAETRRKWVLNLAWEMLYKKGILVDDYLDSLVQLSFKLDELALVIYARMYHVGIGVILRYDFWTTRTNDSL